MTKLKRLWSWVKSNPKKTAGAIAAAAAAVAAGANWSEAIGAAVRVVIGF